MKGMQTGPCTNTTVLGVWAGPTLFAQVNLSKDLTLNVLITAAAVDSLKHIKQEQLLIFRAKQMIHMGCLDLRDLGK